MNSTEFTKLETARLTLDKLTAEDCDAVFQFAGDEAVAKSTTMPYPYSREDAENWIKTCQEDERTQKSFIRAIRLKESNALIGATGFYIDKANSSGEVGYWIAGEFQNQQFGREALEAVVKHAFDTCGINRLWANVFTNNYPSIAILEWCGFTPEGRMREHRFHPFTGKFRDVLIYGMLKRDYDKRKIG